MKKNFLLFFLFLFSTLIFPSNLDKETKKKIIKALLKLNRSEFNMIKVMANYPTEYDYLFKSKEDIYVYKILWEIRNDKVSIDSIFGNVDRLKLQIEKKQKDQEKVPKKKIDVVTKTLLNHHLVSYQKLKKTITILFYYYNELEIAYSLAYKILQEIDIQNDLFCPKFHFLIRSITKKNDFKKILIDFFESEDTKYTRKKIIIACYLSFSDRYFKKYLETLFLSSEGQEWIFYYHEQQCYQSLNFGLLSFDFLYYDMLACKQQNLNVDIKDHLLSQIGHYTDKELGNQIYQMLKMDIDSIKQWYAKTKKIVKHDNILDLWYIP